MEYEEIDVPEGSIPQIGQEGPFAGITVALGKVDIVNPSVNLEVSNEDTLDEINMERTRYLLSTDEIFEEWHSCTQI